MGKLTDFKMKYAEARAAQHPELKDTYSSKIQSMKAAGGWVWLGAACHSAAARSQAVGM